VSDKQRALVILHGAALILLGFLCGLAAVGEELARMEPQTWRAAHGALLLAGAWLLATAAVQPLLVLPARQASALGWSLLVTAYAFSIAILIQAITGVRALSPHDTLAGWVAYGANIVTVGASVLASVLTLVGAWAAVRSHR
jgi:hypothetical protein